MGWLDALQEILNGVETVTKPLGLPKKYVGNPVFGTTQYGVAQAKRASDAVLPDWLHLPHEQGLAMTGLGAVPVAGPVVGGLLGSMYGAALTHPNEIAAAGPGSAAWEASAGYTPLMGRFLNDITSDPMTLLGAPELMGASKGLAGLSEGVRFERPVLQALLGTPPELAYRGRTAEDIATGLRGGNALQQKIAPLLKPGAKAAYYGGVYPQEMFGKYAYAPLKGAGWATKKVTRGLLEYGNVGAATSEQNEVKNAFGEVVSANTGQLPLPGFGIVLPHPNQVPQAQVDPTPGSFWRRLVGDTYLNFKWKAKPDFGTPVLDAAGDPVLREGKPVLNTKPDRTGRVTRIGFTNEDLNELSDVVVNRMEDAFKSLNGTPNGALLYAFNAPQEVYREMIAAHGEAMRDILPAIFREARIKAEARGFTLPDDFLLGIHPLPEIGRGWSNGRVIPAYGEPSGSRGIRSRMQGNTLAPGLFEVGAGEVANELRMEREGGLAALFTLPEQPGMIGRVPEDAQGGLYATRVSDRGRHTIVTHPRFREIIETGATGPHGLTYTSEGRLARDFIHERLNAIFGMPISEADFEPMFQRGIDLHYRQELIEAASGTGHANTELALYTNPQLPRTRTQVYEAIQNVPKYKAIKRSVNGADMFGFVAPDTAAELAKTARGRKVLEEMPYDTASGAPQWNAEGIHTGVMGEGEDAVPFSIRRNPTETLPPNRRELKDLYDRFARESKFGERFTDFYTAAGRTFHKISEGDLRMLDAVSGMIATTSMQRPIIANRELGQHAFASMGEFTNNPDLVEQVAKGDPGIAQHIRNFFTTPVKGLPEHEAGAVRQEARSLLANFDGSLLAQVDGTPKVFAFKLSQMIEARKLALREDLSIPPDVRDKIIEGINKTFADVVTDIWHAGYLGFNDNPSGMQHILSYGIGRRMARELGVMTHEWQSATWLGGKWSSATSQDVIDSMAVALEDTIGRALVENGQRKIDIPGWVKNDWEANIAQSRGGAGSMPKDRQDAIAKQMTRVIKDHVAKDAAHAAAKFGRSDVADLAREYPDPGGTFALVNPKQIRAGLASAKYGNSGLTDYAPGPGHYGVGISGFVIPNALDANGNMTRAAEQKMAEKMGKLLQKFSPAFATAWGDQIRLGYWLPRNENTLYIDATFVLTDLQRAIKHGEELNQFGLWDFSHPIPMARYPKVPGVPEDRTNLGGGYFPSPGVPEAGDILNPEGSPYIHLKEPTGVSPITNGQQLIMRLQQAYTTEPMAERLAQNGEPAHLLKGSDPITGAVVGGLTRVVEAAHKSRFAQGWQALRDRIGEAGQASLATAAPEAVGAIHTPRLAGERHYLSGPSREVMSRTFTEGPEAGKTYDEVIHNYQTRAEKGIETLKASGIKFDDKATVKTRQGLIADPDAKWVLGELDKHKITANAENADALTMAHMDTLIAAKHGVDTTKRMSRYQVLMSAWGQQALMSPRYHASNITGSWMQMIAAGYRPPMSLPEYHTFIKAMFAKEGRDLTAENLSTTKMAEIFAHYGITDLPAELARTHAEYGARGVSGTNQLGVVAEKVAGKKLGHIVGQAADVNQAIAASWEWYVRSSMASDIFENQMRRAMPVMQKEMMEAGSRLGVDLTGKLDFTTMEGFGGRRGTLSIPGMQDTLMREGLTRAEAEKVVGKFLNVRQKALDTAVKEVDRVHFSYKFTKLDEMIAKVIPFHYWASRALRFYTEEMLRHPMLIHWYNELTDGIDRMNADPGLDARSKGFVNLMAGPHGFTLMTNPMALLGVAKMYNLDTPEAPTGETTIGKIARYGKSHGVSLFPWVDATLNYMGAYGDTFAPDPAGLRTRQLVGGVVNYASAELGMQPQPAPYEAMNVKMREWMSSLMSSIAPGWIDEPVMAKSSEDGTMARASLDDIITSRIMAEHPQMTNGAMLDILNDPDSPEYDKAYREVAQAGLINQLLNFTMPTNFKVKENTRDVSMAQRDTIRDAAKAAGVRPEAFVPSMADAEFKTVYKNMTGNDFKPGDYEHAQFKRDLASATPQAQKFVIQSYEYNAIGSDKGQRLMQTAQDIRTGEWTPPEFAAHAATLTEDERNLIADDWLAKNDPGNLTAGIKDLQHSYRTLHPEFDQFKQWQGQMFNLKTSYGPQGFAHYRAIMTQSNPNAARYFQQTTANLIKNNPGMTPDEIQRRLDGATISPDSWMAATGVVQSKYSAGVLPTNGYDPGTQAVDMQQAGFQQNSLAPPPPPAFQTWTDILKQYA